VKRRTAILISGGGSNMLALVRAMQEPDYPAEPVLVLSNEAGAPGLAHARAGGLTVAAVPHRDRPRADFEAALNAELARVRADFVLLAGFMRVLSAEFVSPWLGRMLNIHPSLLPKYPGLNTHARALAAGDAEHGASVHLVTPALDGGPVIGRTRIAVEPGDTPESLAARLLPKEHLLYPEVARRAAMGTFNRFEL
jgi:phosphoribosylglycinamide formyltransferase-1